jgi:DNA-directed RNA polymerase subunit RPC12/RpoP
MGTKAFVKKTVKCPECSKEVTIFDEDGEGVCTGCGVDVEAIHRRVHYQNLSEKVRKESEQEPAPAPDPKPPKKEKKDKGNPFDFDMK